MPSHDSDIIGDKRSGRFVSFDELERGEDMTRRSMMLMTELSWSVSRLLSCFGQDYAYEDFEHIQAIRHAKRTMEHYSEFIAELTRLYEEEQKLDATRRSQVAGAVKSILGGADSGGDQG